MGRKEVGGGRLEGNTQKMLIVGLWRIEISFCVGISQGPEKQNSKEICIKGFVAKPLSIVGTGLSIVGAG